MINVTKYDLRSVDGIIEPPHEYVLTGKAIVFNEPTLIGNEFYEIIKPTAITRDVLKDVALLVNHETGSLPLARTRNKTLELDIREDGVYFSAKLNPNMGIACDLYEAVIDKLIDSCSFAFCDTEESWDFSGKFPTRTITKIGYLPEISLVTNPAYKNTSVSARSKESFDEARREKIKAEIRQKFEQKRKDELKAQISERLRKEK